MREGRGQNAGLVKQVAVEAQGCNQVAGIVSQCGHGVAAEFDFEYGLLRASCRSGVDRR